MLNFVLKYHFFLFIFFAFFDKDKMYNNFDFKNTFVIVPNNPSLKRNIRKITK